MPDKKLTIGLPVALLLGGSAIAFGVVPGVRDWVDNAVPWLGINGPKVAAEESVPKGLESARTTTSLPTTGLSSESLSSESLPTESLPTDGTPIQLNKPKFDVQFAGGVEPIPAEPVLSAQEGAPASTFLRTTQASPLQSVPATGLNVPSYDNGVLIVPLATVSFPDDITVSATSEGTIMNLLVDDGTVIEAGMPMIEIDSRLAEEEVKVATQELMAATLKAEDDSNVKYSEAAKAVATKDVEISMKLYRQGAEGEMENEKKQLELKKATLQVNVSTIEKARDKADVGVKTAKLDASKVQIELRRINAQRTGIVHGVVKRQFSYVRAGEPILNLTSMEKMRIIGTTPKLTDSPHLLLNAPARVTINYAENKSETVNGTVTFVSPKSTYENQYQFHVDLPNKLTSDGQYLFRQGMRATIEVTPRSR